jgi:hypothetical protein
MELGESAFTRVGSRIAYWGSRPHPCENLREGTPSTVILGNVGHQEEPRRWDAPRYYAKLWCTCRIQGRDGRPYRRPVACTIVLDARRPRGQSRLYLCVARWSDPATVRRPRVADHPLVCGALTQAESRCVGERHALLYRVSNGDEPRRGPSRAAHHHPVLAEGDLVAGQITCFGLIDRSVERSPCARRSDRPNPFSTIAPVSDSSAILGPS